MIFDSWLAIARVVGVSIAAYAALILVLRLSGKRSLAKLNAFDLVVTVALGSTLATVLLSKDVAFVDGVLSFVMLAALQWALTEGSVRWNWLKRLVRAEPRLLVEDGQYLDGALDAERVTRDEADQAIRNAGIGRVEQVAAVVLETDGSLSVIARDDGPGELTALRSVRPTRDPESPAMTSKSGVFSERPTDRPVGQTSARTTSAVPHNQRKGVTSHGP